MNSSTLQPAKITGLVRAVVETVFTALIDKLDPQRPTRHRMREIDQMDDSEFLGLSPMEQELWMQYRNYPEFGEHPYTEDRCPDITHHHP